VKIEIVVDAKGTPLAQITDAASVHETMLAGAVLASIPETVEMPDQVPVIADRAYDSDPLRDDLAEQGYELIAPHRRSRRKPPTNDGRKLRRYRRRYIVERTFAWLHSFRRVVTRFERGIHMYDGFVQLACAFIALNKL
jgi:transposase